MKHAYLYANEKLYAKLNVKHHCIRNVLVPAAAVTVPERQGEL